MGEDTLGMKKMVNAKKTYKPGGRILIEVVGLAENLPWWKVRRLADVYAALRRGVANRVRERDGVVKFELVPLEPPEDW